MDIPETDEKLFEECLMQTFRASGAGGQHVNTTDSAVRLIHSASNLSVTCQQSRSQHKNKAIALQKLRKLLEEKNKKKKRRIPTKQSWSSKNKNLKKNKQNSDKKKLRQKPNF